MALSTTTQNTVPDSGASFWGRLALWIKRQSSGTILTAAVIAVLVVGYVDYVTGYEVSLFLFYSVPILFVVWFGDRQSSILISILSALVWWWADEKAGHPYITNWVQTYNVMVRLVFFFFVVAGGSALKAQIMLLERSQLLEREIIRISEREQQRIGQDLHDGLCQYLAAIGCAASSLRNDLRDRGAAEAGAASEIAELLKQGVTQTRNISRGLFPVQADEAGLEAALQELALSTTRLMNVQCEFESKQDVPIYDNTVATHLYRISQEALNNATRHGNATKVRISLSSENDRVILQIVDNGKGLPQPPADGEGMGLKIMDYRARLIGGALNISDRPEGGTVVTCTFKQTVNPSKETKLERIH